MSSTYGSIKPRAFGRGYDLETSTYGSGSSSFSYGTLEPRTFGGGYDLSIDTYGSPGYGSTLGSFTSNYSGYGLFDY